jgi:hypothetical protein
MNKSDTAPLLAMENQAEVLGDTERKYAYSKHTLRWPDIKKAVAKSNSKYIVIIPIDEMVTWSSRNRPRFGLWVVAYLFGPSLNACTSTAESQAFTYVQPGVRS